MVDPIRPRGKRILAAVLLLLIGAGGGLFAEAAGPAPARFSPAPDGALRIHPEDRCPVCAMRPARLPDFAAAVSLRDGRAYYFCSCRCMIRAWLRPDAYLGAGRDDRAGCTVLDYFRGAPLDGESSWWVAGSDVAGPMGPALVPLETPEAAEAFRRRHGGEPPFRLGDLTEDRWREMTGTLAAPGLPSHGTPPRDSRDR